MNNWNSRPIIWRYSEYSVNRHLFFEKLCVCSCTWWAKHFYHVIEMAVGKGLILFLFCPKGQNNFDINDFYLKNYTSSYNKS